MRRGGFWEIAENGEPVLEQLRAVVSEENIQSLHVALLRERKRREERNKMDRDK